MSFFQVSGMTAGYGKNPVLRDISFSMDEGCVLGVLGANGSGKTTLIKAICGILPHSGHCFLENTELEKLSSREIAKRIGYIPQRSGLSVDISALDVVLMGFNPQLGLLEYPDQAMREKGLNILAQVGLCGFADENYLRLSEGQKQLCILARTMVGDSRLLLLDEPEGALDFQHRYRMLKKIRHWADLSRGGAIVTLHDPALALHYCDRLLLLKDGGLLDILMPREDSLSKMEEKLSCLYGAVSLQRCVNRSGEKWLTMLKEDEE